LPNTSVIRQLHIAKVVSIPCDGQYDGWCINYPYPFMRQWLVDRSHSYS